MSSVTLKTLRKKRSSHGTIITRLVNKIESYSTKEPLQMDVAQLDDFLSSLKKSSEDYFEAHLAIIDKCDSEQAAKEEDVLDQQELTIDEAMSQLRVLRQMREAHSMIADLTIEVETLEQTISDYPDYSLQYSVHKAESRLNDLRSVLRQSSISRDNNVYSNMKTIQSQIMRLSITKDMGETLSNSDKLCQSRCSHVHSDSNHYHLPKIELPKFYGDPLNWASFWQNFEASVHTNKSLREEDKLTYLRAAIKDKRVSDILNSTMAAPGEYDQLITDLKQRYDQRRQIHETHVMAIVKHPSIKGETRDELQSLRDMLHTNIRGLRNMDQFDAGAILTSLTVNKFTKRLRESWLEHTEDTKQVPDVDKLIKFLDRKIQARSSTAETAPVKPLLHKSEIKSRQFSALHSVQATANCKLCNGDKHPLYFCPAYKDMSVIQRSVPIKNNKCCSNCLIPGHKTKEFRNSGRCRRCGKRHHTTLHQDNLTSSDSHSTSENKGSSQALTESTASVSAVSTNSSEPDKSTLPHPTLVMTGQVLVESASGQRAHARALLDTGATLSLITSKLAHQLQLPKEPCSLTFTGVTGTTNGTTSHMVSFSISDIHNRHTKFHVQAPVVPKVTTDLPLFNAKKVRDYPHLQGLQLADPRFDTPGRIDIILGIDVWDQIELPGKILGVPSQPSAKNTIFGWAIYGKCLDNANSIAVHHISVNHLSVVPSCNELLQRFWYSEEIRAVSQTYSSEEQAVLDHYKDNHLYTGGKYQVALPKKFGHQALGESRQQAIRRYYTNERSLHKHGNWDKLQSVVQEYFDLGHAEQVPDQDMSKVSSSVFYMPMHSVIKESSTTTKLRVVFDASAKSSTGISLNDTLQVGPTIYPSLTDILIRFRSFKIAVSSDISKMYRAVELSPSDRDLHRFVWRRDSSTPLFDYRMTRITFGVAASAFAAIRSLQQTALDFGYEFPLAKPHIFDSFYVNDCLAGADNVEQAFLLQEQLQGLLEKGGFLLRKWAF